MRTAAVTISGCMTPRRHAAWFLVVLLVTQLPGTLQAFPTCGSAEDNAAAADGYDACWQPPEHAHQSTCGGIPGFQPLQHAPDPAPTAKTGSARGTSDSGIACRVRAGRDSNPSSSCYDALLLSLSRGCAAPGPANSETFQSSQSDVDNPFYLSDDFCSLLSPSQMVREFHPSTPSPASPCTFEADVCVRTPVKTRCVLLQLLSSCSSGIGQRDPFDVSSPANRNTLRIRSQSICPQGHNRTGLNILSKTGDTPPHIEPLS